MIQKFVFRIGAVILGLGTLSARVDAQIQPAFKKTMIVLFENTDYQKTLAQPFFAKIAKDGALLTSLFAEQHPSQGNYIALIAGNDFGITSDSNIDLSGKQIGDLLEAKGKNWKIYLEGYPGNCFTGARSGTYVRKHNPFISFTSIQQSPSRCAHLVNATELATDIQSGNLPDFSLYIPDLNNDGHDTGVAFADQWYSRTFGPLLNNPRFMRDMLLISTFDESSRLGGNHIYAALNGSMITPGSSSNASLTHIDLLRTVEDGLGIGSLGEKDAQARGVTGVWKLPLK